MITDVVDGVELDFTGFAFAIPYPKETAIILFWEPYQKKRRVSFLQPRQ